MKLFTITKLFILLASASFIFSYLSLREIIDERVADKSQVKFIRNFIRRSNSNITKRIAVFVQAHGLSDPLVQNDIFKCIKNVGKAKDLAENFFHYPWVNVESPERFIFDVFITHPHSDERFSTFKSRLKALGPENVFGESITLNEGMDIKQFLLQLQLADSFHSTNGINYHSFLKIHSKSERYWRRAMFDSLCGTPAVVLTVLRRFSNTSRDIGLVIPQGFAIQRFRDTGALFRPLRKFIGNKPEICFKGDMENMKVLYREMYGKALDADADFVFSAGTMFWSRYQDFRVADWIKILPWMSTRWSAEYRADQLLEHAMERLFVSIPYLNNVTLAEIAPAVKPIGIYFPQYHEIPENNAIHGKGFTEWTLLKPSLEDNLMKPLDEKFGGLGYYDLTDVQIRRKQGEMAKAAGVEGFMYYHYWFAGESKVNYTNPVLGKIPELMLEDGHPDLPFMFCWANEPWTDKWSGMASDQVLLPQEYGGEEEWERHFYYLLPFFKHHKYIKVDEKPVFVFYRIGLMKKILGPMLNLWRNLAVQNGIKGLHIIHALNNFVKNDNLFKSKKPSEFCDASFQFFPTLINTYPELIKTSSSVSDVYTPTNEQQYWGGYTTFNNIIRRKSQPSVLRVTPQQFRSDLNITFRHMLTDLPYSEKQVNVPNFFFITAWNEWNEQATLEPSDKYGFSYLSALKENVENQPLAILS